MRNYLFGPLWKENDGETDGTAGNVADPDDNEESILGEDGFEGNEDGDEDDEDDDNDSDDDSIPPAQDEETQKALNLFRLLQNPETSAEMIKVLADRAGFKIAEATEKSKTDFISMVTQVLQEELGDDIVHIPAKFSNALARLMSSQQQAIETANGEIKKLRADLTNKELSSEKIKVDKAVSWAEKNLPGFKENSPAILEKMSKLHPAPGQEYKEYLKDIHSLVVNPSMEVQRRERIKKNAEGRLPSESTSTERANPNIKTMTAAQAAAKAFDEIMGRKG